MNWERNPPFRNKKDSYTSSEYDLELFEKDGEHFWRLENADLLIKLGSTDLVAPDDIEGAWAWAERLINS